MTDNKYQDFDAFMEESGVESRQVKGFEYNGEKFDIPDDLPAKIGLQIQRRFTNATEAQMVDNIEWLLTALLGKDDYERLLDTGIGLKMFEVVLEWVFKQYGLSMQKVEQSNPKVQRGKK